MYTNETTMEIGSSVPLMQMSAARKSLIDPVTVKTGRRCHTDSPDRFRTTFPKCTGAKFILHLKPLSQNSGRTGICLPFYDQLISNRRICANPHRIIGYQSRNSSHNGQKPPK